LDLFDDFREVSLLPFILPKQNGYSVLWNVDLNGFEIKLPNGELFYSPNFFNKKISDRCVEYFLENDRYDIYTTNWKELDLQEFFKINFEKLEKILINSSSQCGRSSIIKLDIYKNIDTFIKDNPDTYFLDFSQTSIDSKVLDIKTLMIGTEGGFSKRERELFNKNFVVGFSSNLILKSQTAIISATSKIIL